MNEPKTDTMKTANMETFPSSNCPCSGGGSAGDFEILPNPPELGTILNAIFTDEYMKEFTNFDSFEAFKYSSAVIVNWNKDPLIYSHRLFDNFVNESTQFQTFDEMVLHAMKQRT